MAPLRKILFGISPAAFNWTPRRRCFFFFAQCKFFLKIIIAGLLLSHAMLALHDGSQHTQPASLVLIEGGVVEYHAHHEITTYTHALTNVQLSCNGTISPYCGEYLPRLRRRRRRYKVSKQPTRKCCCTLAVRNIITRIYTIESRLTVTLLLDN